MPQFPPHTALVVEPDPLSQERLRQILHRAGIARVLAAASAQGASITLAEELVDLVLTRWKLPDAQGLPLLRTLRGRGRNGRVPVVLLDEGQPPESRVAAVKWGIAGRLPDPPTLDALTAVLRTVGDDLRRRAAARP
ncbi:MAG: response regulator [Candidatus Lambdaproteobacteria bacterium]|nr:response regulator [Candidatus Lambdaproteobacteria bacterium]